MNKKGVKESKQVRYRVKGGNKVEGRKAGKKEYSSRHSLRRSLYIPISDIPRFLNGDVEFFNASVEIRLVLCRVGCGIRHRDLLIPALAVDLTQDVNVVIFEEDRALDDLRSSGRGSVVACRRREGIPYQCTSLVVESGHVAPLPVEVAAVLLGDAGGVHEG